MFMHKGRYVLASGCLASALLLGLLALTGGRTMASPVGPSAPAKPQVKAPPMADQTIPGTPVRAVARDSGTVGIFYNNAAQYYSDYAEGVYLWVNSQVWGPSGVPLGPTVNEYTTVSNSLSGNGTSLTP